jgi:hypothetical protein
MVSYNGAKIRIAMQICEPGIFSLLDGDNLDVRIMKG